MEVIDIKKKFDAKKRSFYSLIEADPRMTFVLSSAN